MAGQMKTGTARNEGSIRLGHHCSICFSKFNTVLILLVPYNLDILDTRVATQYFCCHNNVRNLVLDVLFNKIILGLGRFMGRTVSQFRQLTPFS